MANLNDVLQGIVNLSSKISTKLKAKSDKQYKSATTAATAQWYRIAQSTSGIDNCLGTFDIQASVSGKHSVTQINAGVSYGITNGINLQQMSHTIYVAAGITKARIVYHTTYSNNYAYLEVYVPTATATGISVKLTEGFGWSLVAPNTVGSVPSGYTSKEINFVAGKIVSNIKGALDGNANSATKLATARDITVGNKTNSFDGTGAVTYTLSDIGAASTSHTHTGMVQAVDTIGSTNVDATYVTHAELADELDSIDTSNLQPKTDNTLQTTNKTVTGAINELFQSAGNAKQMLVGALAAQGVLSSTSETFDELISKVKNIEGSGDNSLQYATGTYDDITLSSYSAQITVNTNLDFEPYMIFIKLGATTYVSMQNIVVSSLAETKLSGGSSSDYCRLSIPGFSQSDFTLKVASSSNSLKFSNIEWYAFGESSSNSGGSLDIISASSLPATGKDNQICIISSDPDYDVLVTTNAKEALVDPTIVMYLGNSSSADVSLGTQAQIGNMMYYFNRVMFGTERLPSYIWSNNQWNELTKAYIPVFESGIVYTGSLLGDPNITTTTSPVKILETNELAIVGNGYVRGFTYPTLVNFENFSRIEITLRNYAATYIDFWVGMFLEHHTNKIDLGTNTLTSTYAFNSAPLQHNSTSFKTFTIDISSWTGSNYYLGFCACASSGNHVFIHSIKLY